MRRRRSTPRRAAATEPRAGSYTRPMHELPERVAIDLAERSYDILIGAHLLDAPHSYAGLPGGGAAVIVTNTTVAPLLGERLRAALQLRYPRVLLVSLP